MDEVRFLMSANAGETPGRISKIASGGELARIMLVMKDVLSERDGVPAMVFDEIDEGVSGIAAQQIVNVRKIIVEMLPPHPTGIHDLRHGDPFQRLLGHELLQRTADGLTSGLGGFIPFSHLTAPFR